MRLEEVDIPNTALETRYGHFNFTVMPFRFNECASDRDLRYRVCQPYLDRVVVVFVERYVDLL